jgi:hypothetical protein
MGHQHLDVAKNTRSDKGQTVFNSDEKRESVYTERNCFSKIFRVKYKGETFDESEITMQYNRLAEDHPLEEGSKAASTSSTGTISLPGSRGRQLAEAHQW